jgi:hypothetical protein
MKVAIFSPFGKLTRRARLQLFQRRTQDTLQRRQKANKISKTQKYYYIKYATGALRAVAWIVLVIGVIASFVWGINMGGIEGGIRIILGIVGSFLTWLLLLAAREILRLFIDVKENTRKTAEQIGE